MFRIKKVFKNTDETKDTFKKATFDFFQMRLRQLSLIWFKIFVLFYKATVS